jgi:hypothetical protein
LSHPFVQTYAKTLDANGEEIPVKDNLEQSPEENEIADRLIKLGKEARSKEIKLELLQDKSVSTGSRQSIRGKNDGSNTLLSVNPSETKNTGFFPLARPTTPMNNPATITSFKDLKEKEKTLFEIEKFTTIDAQIKLKNYKNSIEKNSSQSKNKSPITRKSQTIASISLKDLLKSKAPDIPQFNQNAKTLQRPGPQQSRGSTPQNLGKPRISHPFAFALKKMVDDKLTKPGRGNVMNVSTYNLGYNQDESMAYLDQTLLDEDRVDKENPANLSRIIPDLAELMGTTTGGRRKSKQLDFLLDLNS